MTDIITELLGADEHQADDEHPPDELVATDHPKGIDNTNHPLAFAQPSPEPDGWDDVLNIDPVALDRAYRQMRTQYAVVMELLRHPQPVWVRPSDEITTPTGSVSSAGQVIAEAALNRFRCTVRNTGASVIYLCSATERNSRVGTIVGFPIDPGDKFTLDTKAPLFVFTETGATSTYALVLEYVELEAK